MINYYLLASDVSRLNRLNWVMSTSLLKTLACKYSSSVSKMAARYQATVETPHGLRRCFQVSVERDGRKPLIATFGGIPLKRQKRAVLYDRKPAPLVTRRKELISRLVAGRCELCGNVGEVDVHHIGKLAQLGKSGKSQPAWVELMTKRRRKTLVVCATCHGTIHARQPIATIAE